MEAAAEEVRYEVQGAQALLTIDRPKARNALSGAVIDKLLEGIDRAERDPAVRVLVLTGAGEKVFCAGGDLASMPGEDGFLGLHEGRRRYGQLLSRLSSCARPTVARCNGHVLAGGLGLMLACDFAVLADDAEWGTPEIDVGLFPMMVMALLQRHVGRKPAYELVMLGERRKAEEAVRLGLATRAVPRSELDSAVRTLVEKLASKSPAILKLGKRAFLAAEDLPLAPALELLASQLSLNTLAEDAGEGVAAFLEKRKPEWKGR